jgi:DNA recombination protein RmuC
MAAEKLALLDEAQAKLRDVFKALSADALNTNNQAFLDLARAALGEYQANAARDLEGRHRAIDDLVRPLRESLDKVDAELRAMEQVRAGAYSTLAEQLRSLSATQQALHSETANLVKALRAPTVRGRWGEIQLKRVVEMAGMLDHCDFYEQQSGATEQGRLVPDLVVRLPGDRHIVVDAKVPLMAYLEALDASDDAGREARMKDHARHVRQHMARLSSKAYWEQFQPAPEFVVMFLPGETFFGAALLHDPSLIEAGVDQRVILSSPITLIALLRAVAYGWRQELIARNAQDISEVGRTLYERLRVMAEHVEDIGRALDGAVAAYNHAIGSMETRVIVAARRLKEMGVGVSKDLPELQPIERAPRALQHRELVNGSAEPGAPVAPGEPV